MAYRYFSSRVISLLSLLMLKSLDLALRLMVLRDFLDYANSFSMSLMVVFIDNQLLSRGAWLWSVCRS